MVLPEVTEALAAIGEPSEFALSATCSAAELGLEVKKVGPIQFPISARQARLLCAAGRLASFGLGEKTLRDTDVRNTFEIARSAVKLDERRWQAALEPELAAIKRRLGLDPAGTLEAKLDKLLVYGPGQFFKQHQDSERSDAMVGTLLVVLPSKHTGGAVAVEHHGETRTFRPSGRGAKRLALIAFYADCRHEVQPVKSGYRVALTYHLLYAPAPTGSALPALAPGATARLARSVERYFATPEAPPSWVKEPPQRPARLIYLLDHEYTQRSLGWGRLKQQDRLRAESLREIATELGCEANLALAEVHETWDCEGDEWGFGWGGRRHAQHDADEERDPEDYELIELQDVQIELSSWLGADGKPKRDLATAPASKREVCSTKPSAKLNPFRSEHEGYMGNYGNTVDRWYHRAAVVLWPLALAFAIRAELGPAWAIGEILALARRGATDEARAKARSLLAFWSRSATRDTRAAFFVRTLRAAAALGDPELATALLVPFGVGRLGPASLGLLPALSERFGLDWAEALFASWTKPTHATDQVWPSGLPRVSEALASAGGNGRELACRLLTAEISKLSGRLEQAPGEPMPRGAESLVGRLCQDIVSLLESAVAVGTSAHRDAMVTAVAARDPRRHLALLGALLGVAAERRRAAELKALGLGPVHGLVVSEVERRLALPERAASDWTIVPPRGCDCGPCAELAAFLRHPDRIRLDVKAADDKRQHLSRIVDAYGLPVGHETLRRGSPYTLQLRKLERLFAQSAIERVELSKLLVRLRKSGRAFGAAP